MSHPTTDPIAPSDPLLTRPQAWDYLGVSRRFLDGEAAAGRLHPIRLGRSIRYRVSELERYLETCATPRDHGRL
ncbi:helix-turn-helix domain-containing protein [Kribbia dieselivorans]|uniref:helix-turn-helix domain-containing protein n=1 Tax=Kribbia dieselivorans TaxID=331526 RepID=UPI000839090A|nr:helix-turn-helix domain-containing protein [Kribbia dieselivorans]